MLPRSFSSRLPRRLCQSRRVAPEWFTTSTKSLIRTRCSSTSSSPTSTSTTRPRLSLPPPNPDLSPPLFPPLIKNSIRIMSEAEIEELHQAALSKQSTTYTDPSTGFLVFTELAHLQRGKCCGNTCRHCPYGWENARDTVARRPAVVQTGDKEAIRARLQDIEDLAKPDRQAHQEEEQAPDLTESATTTTSATATKPAKTGGRHGGRLTKKNVPYTRGGDKGTSQLLTGERRSKADSAFEAMGTVDELCSFVGVVHAQLMQDAAANPELLLPSSSNIDIRDQLLEIMSRLFDIGSHVAKPAKVPRPKEEDDDDSDNSESDSSHDETPKTPFVADGIGGGFDPQHVQELEDWVDQLTDDLPELNSFLLPTGSLAAAHLHTARCVCRRAERRMVPLVQVGVCDPNALRYVNRLSDYLFSASRWVNLIEAKTAEIQYRRPHRGAKQRLRVAQEKE